MLTYLLPVETSSRELDYKLTLASLLRSPHRQFVLFRPDLAPLLVRLARHAVWIGQNIRTRTGDGLDYSGYQLLKSRGCGVIFLDEEGGIFPGDETEWQRRLRTRFAPEVLDADDAIVGWGSFASATWRAGPAPVRATIIESGHPRFDLCREPYSDTYAEDVAALHQRLGRFVLINTSFAHANYASGLAGLFTKRDGYQPERSSERLDFVDRWHDSLRLFGTFVAGVHRLAAQLPEVRFVVRPHPVENHQIYQRLFAGVHNISVEASGNVIVWIRAALAVVHNGCTTAVEAFLAGTPTISYQPDEGDARHAPWIPNALSSRATTIEQLLGCLRDAIAGKLQRAQPDEPTRQRMGEVLAQLDPACPAGSAFQALQELALTVERRMGNGGHRFHDAAARAVAVAHSQAVAAKRHVVRGKGPSVGSSAPPKFQGFRRQVLEARCRQIARVTGRSLGADVFSESVCVVR